MSTHKRSTKARGYGARHQRLRRWWAARVATGRVACWRCGQLIAPGAPWHLGHDDHDRTQYRGPEHPACNLGAPRRPVAARQVVPSPRPVPPPRPPLVVL